MLAGGLRSMLITTISRRTVLKAGAMTIKLLSVRLATIGHRHAHAHLRSRQRLQRQAEAEQTEQEEAGGVAHGAIQSGALEKGSVIMPQPGP